MAKSFKLFLTAALVLSLLVAFAGCKGKISDDTASGFHVSESQPVPPEDFPEELGEPGGDQGEASPESGNVLSGAPGSGAPSGKAPSGDSSGAPAGSAPSKPSGSSSVPAKPGAEPSSSSGASPSSQAASSAESEAEYFPGYF